jgi:hypothetical protein
MQWSYHAQRQNEQQLHNVLSVYQVGLHSSQRGPSDDSVCHCATNCHSPILNTTHPSTTSTDSPCTKLHYTCFKVTTHHAARTTR